MAYTTAAQAAVADDPLDFLVYQINAADGSIAQDGTTGLTLAAGTYLVTFTADAEAATPDGAVGAALALDGTLVPYAQTAAATTDTEQRRITVNSILNLTETQTLTVVNNADNTVTYSNTALTVVKLT